MRLRHPLVPPHIRLEWMPLDPSGSAVAPFCLPSTRQAPSAADRGAHREQMRRSGDRLFQELAAGLPGEANSLHLERREMQRPRLWKGGSEWPVSLSHTSQLIAAALSSRTAEWVGIDVERVDRAVPGRLRSRILHPAEEGDGIANRTPLIRIWTAKEAALKWAGTGLREPMTGVLLNWRSPGCIEALFRNGMRLEIRSFVLNEHWISLAFGQRFSADAYSLDDTGSGGAIH